MAKNKLLRFSQIKEMPNVFEYPFIPKGSWQAFFKNTNPIVVELACGKGEYVNGLSDIYSEKNFIGIDIKGNRIWCGANLSIQKNKNNVAFIRGDILKIEEFFTPQEISEIWITFPDPFLKNSKAKKRLTHPRFLNLYAKVLQKEGSIKLKTDSPDLFLFTKQIIKENQLNLVEEVENINTLPADKISAELKIKTYYEGLNIAKSNKIFYLSFTLNHDLKNAKNL